MVTVVCSGVAPVLGYIGFKALAMFTRLPSMLVKVCAIRVNKMNYFV